MRILRVIILLLLFAVSSPVIVHAKTIYQTIDHWDDGHGVTEDGTVITDGWGYDGKSAAGKYVYFDREGNVRKKVDSPGRETSADEMFTDTDDTAGVLVLHAEVFTGFEGTVSLVLSQKENEIEKEIPLTAGNLYRKRLSLSPGTYEVCAQAEDDEGSYQVEISPETVAVQLSAVKSITVTVKDEKVAAESLEDEAVTEGQDDRQATGSAATAGTDGAAENKPDENNSVTAKSRFPFIPILLGVVLLGSGGMMLYGRVKRRRE